MALGRILQRRGGPTEPPEPELPDAVADLIEAIEEPLLIVHGQRVAYANAAARTLLGTHVVAEDIRVALRHPAAAPVVTGAEDGPVSLSGLGGHDRLWELVAHDIVAGQRLLRFTDRTASRASERMRVDFVANASHELRTPLATLIGFIETLEDANGPEDAAVRARFLGIMAGEARRMQRLIDDLMSLSRIEADRYARPRDRIDLGRVVAMACADMETGAPGRLRFERIPPAIMVEGDEGQLSQLVHNIGGNALKYGKADGAVEVALTASAMSARLTVRDEGEGIAPEHLPRLTERFYRVDAGRSRAVGGTGLGLAIVKHIVERHRGTLEIESAVGHGTTVIVTLPLAADLS